ncbi:hypothetical protein DFH27DRAFT_540958 [Peziza echinospora]|nr:hypothetical protein DFH27DRAFT_540958 [Peziza echinospora]
MSSPQKYILVALPTSIVPHGDEETALASLKSRVPQDAGAVTQFHIPTFKIGTLDALVLQADELAKVDQQVESAVAKVADVLRSICPDGSEEHKTVNDKSVDEYLRSFTWSNVKYRSERSIADLIEVLHQEVVTLDNDLKHKFQEYQSVRTNLTSLERKVTGNLSTKSLYNVVDKEDFISGSEYLETILVAVPNALKGEWFRSYETLAPMVVPRSSSELASDDEFTLFNVTLFKKHTAEFVHKARAKKFVPRDFKWTANGTENAHREAESVRQQERSLHNQTLALARAAWNDEFMAWIHIKALRVFVESVLRYGLPLEIISAVIGINNSKGYEKVKKQLDSAYNYLGGNAFGRDKKGNIRDDLPSDLATGDTAEYSAYVFYSFEIL